MTTTMRTCTSLCCPRCGNESLVFLRRQTGVAESELKGIAFECHECLLGGAFTYEEFARKQHKKISSIQTTLNAVAKLPERRSTA